jgi:lysozyme family protein
VLTDEAIIDGILEDEGGDTFTNRADDAGGPTKFGITAATLGDSRGLGRPATAEEVQALQEPEAREIYRRRYIEGPGFGRVTSAALRGVLADCATLHGPSNAVRMLQRALGGLKVDAQLGPITLAAVNAAPGISLARRVQYDRIRFIGRLVTKDLDDMDKDGIPDNAEHAWGWLRRVADQLDRLEMP